MEGVIAGLLREKHLVYLDNILVMGTIFLAHLENLCAVFFVPSLNRAKTQTYKVHVGLPQGWISGIRGLRQVNFY